MEPLESRSDFRTRMLPAEPSEVFAAMSDPARVARWWGPAGFTHTIHQFEFFVGRVNRLSLERLAAEVEGGKR